MEKMQRTLLLILPLAFLFVILRFPSGLVLYWVTTNLWTTGQGLITRRLVPKKPATPPKRSSRTPPRQEPGPPPVDGDAAAAKEPKGQPPRPPRKVKRKKKARR